LYPFLDLIAGILCVPLIWGLHHVSTSWAPRSFSSEKRAPALFDSLLQAIFIAPFFVWLECLFYMGYRKEFQFHVAHDAAKNIAAFRKLQSQPSRFE
jgi:uncharacterized membrane protein YGL010W